MKLNAIFVLSERQLCVFKVDEMDDWRREEFRWLEGNGNFIGSRKDVKSVLRTVDRVGGFCEGDMMQTRRRGEGTPLTLAYRQEAISLLYVLALSAKRTRQVHV